jgi:hypothetical protein
MRPGADPNLSAFRAMAAHRYGPASSVTAVTAKPAATNQVVTVKKPFVRAWTTTLVTA